MSEPTLESMRLEIDAARKAFRARARAILFDAYQNADAMAGAIGEVSADQAFEVWARSVREALEAPSPSSIALQEHPLKPSEDADALHPRQPLEVNPLTILRQFVGFISGDVPELHHVEVPRLEVSLQRFLLAALDAPAEPPPPNGCDVDNYSRRVCERGTMGCIVGHLDDAPAEPTHGDS